MRPNEARQINRADAGKGVGQRTRYRHGGIRKGRGGGEPVGSGDIETDQPWHGRASEAESSKNGNDQAEGRDPLGEPLRLGCSDFQRRLDHRQSEHQMRDDRSKDSGDNLRRRVERRLTHRKVAFEGEYERD